jgi:hypothetical protein
VRKTALTDTFAAAFYALWCCDSTDEATRIADVDHGDLFGFDELPGPQARAIVAKMVQRKAYVEALRFIAASHLAHASARKLDAALSTWVREFFPLAGDRGEEDAEIQETRRQTIQSVRGQIRGLKNLGHI